MKANKIYRVKAKEIRNTKPSFQATKVRLIHTSSYDENYYRVLKSLLIREKIKAKERP